MDNLQAGDDLTRISDGSRWKFLHYKPINIGMNSVRADYEGDDFPAADKSLVHVRGWDNESNEWRDGDHEEFPVTEFEKA